MATSTQRSGRRPGLLFKGDTAPRLPSSSSSSKRKRSDRDHDGEFGGEADLHRDWRHDRPGSPHKKDKKSKKSKRKHEKKGKRSKDRNRDSDSKALPRERDATSEVPSRQDGTGQIVTSYTTVSGIKSEFDTQLGPGDVLVVSPHPKSGREEARLVSMVVGSNSLTLAKPFSSDIDSPCNYRFLKKPRDLSSELEHRTAKAEEERKELSRAFGTYSSSGKEITFRERAGKGGSGIYRIVKEKTDRELTREEQLDLRAKRKGDKFC